MLPSVMTDRNSPTKIATNYASCPICNTNIAGSTATLLYKYINVTNQIRLVTILGNLLITDYSIQHFSKNLLILFSYHYLSFSKPEPIMLSVLPINPSRISHSFYPLFLYYSHAITYYSCYIL